MNAIHMFVAMAICAAAVFALLAAEQRDSQAGRWIAKPIASLAFVALALSASPVHAYALSIIVALVLSAVGDVLLIPKSVASFRVGIGAFALAHIAFVVAFIERGADVRVLLIALAPLAVAGFLVARALVPRVEPALRGAVIGYSIILTLMLGFACGTAAAHPNSLLLGGAVFFYLSDLTVARDKFVREAFVNRLVGLPLYYAAQVLLALTAR